MSDAPSAGASPSPKKPGKKTKRSKTADVPVFAKSYPRDPELDALVAAFEAGDYARVRDAAPRLAESAERDEVKRAARDLRRRLDPDPVMIYLLLAAVALLAALSIHYWTHGNASP